MSLRAAKTKAATRARPTPRAGRPTRDAAAQLREHILDIASVLLLTQGYGTTSIDAIARQARVSKRTFYHRFADKPALMRAVVERLIDSLRPAAHKPLAEGGDLEQILLHLAMLVLRAALTPRALALHRLVVAESQRFPELANAVAKAGGRQEAVTLISDLLKGHKPNTKGKAVEADFAAEQLLQMIVSLPQLRAIGLGTPMRPAELDLWARRTVALFLHGFQGTSMR